MLLKYCWDSFRNFSRFNTGVFRNSYRNPSRNFLEEPLEKNPGGVIGENCRRIVKISGNIFGCILAGVLGGIHGEMPREVAMSISRGIQDGGGWGISRKLLGVYVRVLKLIFDTILRNLWKISGRYMGEIAGRILTGLEELKHYFLKESMDGILEGSKKKRLE